MFPCKTPSFELNIQLNDVGAYSFSETETNFRILLKMNLFQQHQIYFLNQFKFRSYFQEENIKKKKVDKYIIIKKCLKKSF